MNTKQTIIVRKDLKMRPGKLAAQVAHASMGAFFNTMDLKWYLEDDNLEPFWAPDPTRAWLDDSFTKVVLAVNSRQELLELYDRLEGLVPCALIKDSGRTVFKEPTYTCLGVGPDEVSIIDSFVGHLKLF